MKTNKHGQPIFTSNDICDLIMTGADLGQVGPIVIDQIPDFETAALMLQDVPALIRYDSLVENLTTEEFDHRNQHTWFMPQQYQQLDIAEYVLKLCQSDAELQRCGQELLMFQERGLFNLLRYLKYLVDVMTQNNLIWGVGRGSSTASFVLYKLGVHRIDSLYYDLDPGEFLR